MFDTRNPQGIHPFYKAVEKWSYAQPDVDDELLDRVMNDIADYYAITIYNSGLECPVLSKTTAINAGIEHGVTTLNRASSPGYPWIKYHAKKINFLEIHESRGNTFYKINLTSEAGQQLNLAVDNLVKSCMTLEDFKPMVPFAGHIKDEPVKLEKISNVDSRAFAAAPFEYVIAVRQYFGSALGAIHKNRHILPSKIGINPTSLEWHDMITQLYEVSDIGFDADYKHFDARLLAKLMARLPIVYNRIYQLNDPNWREEDDWIRTNLNNAVVKPNLVIPLNGHTYIVEATGGNPSGQPKTADDNCIINLAHLYAFWLTVFKDDPEKCNINAFLYYVKAIIYGDDLGVAVHPEVIEKYNCKTFAEFMKTWGMQVTDAAKSVNIKKYIKVSEFEFLKRDFIKKGKYWFGPLKQRSFQKMFNFTIGPAHHWDAEPNAIVNNPINMIATMDSAMQEAVFHGPKFYNEIKYHCLKYCKKYKVQWIPLSYNAMVKFKNVPLPLE